MIPNLTLGLSAMLMTSLFVWSPVEGHGRLWTPPGRATMWRKGFKTPTNYNDNQMFCGGLSVEQAAGYKCGLCGEPYDSDRPHEAGGRYATGTVAATYTQGEKVVLQVDLTANHKGWFEFKLCPTNDKSVRATQECLDLYPLTLANEPGTKLYVEKYGESMVNIPVRLPHNLTCDLCMLQWHYHGGNNWGTNKAGKSCDGCGYTSQEEFYGCADVQIKPKNGGGSGDHSPTNIDPTKDDGAATRSPTEQATMKAQTDNAPKPTARVTPFLPPHPDKPKIYQNMKPPVGFLDKLKHH